MFRYEFKRLEDIVNNIDNKRKPLNDQERRKITQYGLYPYCGANGIVDYVDEYLFDEEILCIAEDGSDWSFNKKCSYIMNEKCWVNNHAHVVTARKGIVLRYLYYYLNYSDLSSKITGTTRGKMTKSALNSIEIPIPNYDIQKKLVDVLDKAQALINQRKEQIQACDDLIKSQFIEMFGDTITNEKGWSVRQLQEVGTWQSGGTPSRTKKEYFMGDIDWYSAGELNQLYLEESTEKITQQAIQESSAKLFNKGSMLVGMYDTAAFKMGILKKDSASNQACANIMPNASINIVWLYYNLLHMKKYFLSNRRGIRQKNLNLGMIKEFIIPVPPIELQDQFAQFVQQVDKLKFGMEQSLKELEANFDSLMQRAFKGELF